MRYPSSFVLAVFGLLALWPWLSGSYGSDLVAKIMIYALLALSLELLVGSTGLVCFGQAAFFGIGAYAALLLAPADDSAPSLWVLLLSSVTLAAVFAFAVGSLSLRTQGVYFIMVTLAFSQMAYYVVHDTPLGGGTDGIYMYVKPSWGWIDLDQPNHMYGLIWVSLLLGFVFLSQLLRSPFGRALSGIRVNEQRMKATGFSVFGYKLAAFTLSGAIAGWAGFLFAIKDGFVNPELLSWHLSGAVLVMIILGGLGHIRGALMGAFAFALLQELFQSEAVFGSYAKHWHLGLGLAVMACVAFMPHGLVALPRQLRERLTGRNHAKTSAQKWQGHA
ncbi:branched-chain amino acid ABC transporter permease [Limnohabitans sp.]|uniref:branched-chain amino acid ABC transporter permease n=1 Tax=Limnohabitans sp. TaxID=1907725 RepID=UPI00286ED868|nr:branched-chain amino acid ABC transporter permease [Limnohabitans sp.]